MSTDLAKFLAYMANWTKGSPDNIQPLIDEHNLFVSLGNFDSDTAVNAEFNALIGLADNVRDETVAADAIQIAADTAAVASIFSFGLGMAAFVPLEVNALLSRADISSKSTDLNNKLTTVDADIATLIGPTVSQYITLYKANNDAMAAMRTTGMDRMDGQTCRSILLQFMAQIVMAGGTLDVATFQQYADSARLLYNSPEIQAVYGALDRLNLSAKSDDDLNNCVNSIAGFTFSNSTAVTIVHYVSVGIMINRLGVAASNLSKCNRLAEVLEEAPETSVFKMMGCVGKVFVGLGAIVSVVDAILQIFGIVDVVEQTNQMVDVLSGQIKTSYLNFYDDIRDASQQYNQAIAAKTS